MYRKFKLTNYNLDEGNSVCAYPGPRTRASFRRSCVRSRGPIASHLPVSSGGAQVCADPARRPSTAACVHSAAGATRKDAFLNSFSSRSRVHSSGEDACWRSVLDLALLAQPGWHKLSNGRGNDASFLIIAFENEYVSIF